MAFVKISQLPGIDTTLSPLTAGDVLPIVHGSTTFKIQLSALADYFDDSFNLQTVINYLSTNNVLLSGGSFLDVLSAQDAFYIDSAVFEKYTATVPASNIVTINLLQGTTFNLTLTSNVTSFIISNYAANRTNSFIVFINQDNTGGRTVAWSFSGANVLWPGGTAPTITATANSKDVITFISNDGGTNWYGFTAGLNFSV